MKKRKLLIGLLSAFLLTGALAIAGCEPTDEDSTQPTQMEQIYAQYIIYAQAEGETPLSYEEWLETIKGDKGEPGATGKDGQSVLTGEGQPAKDLGKTGDSYIDLDTWNFYVKTTDGWVMNGNIKGEQGSAAADHNGTEGLEFYPISDTECAVSVGRAQLLKEIVIPSKYKNYTVTTINGQSIGGGFAMCANLEKITIPDSVTSIGFNAFFECYNLTSVYITDIAAWCNISFGGHLNTNPLYYAKNLYLNNELVTELIIPDSVTSIGNEAFDNCDSLTSVVIPDSVTTIGYYAFYSCNSLTSVEIGDSVTSIGEYAFAECYKLVEVVNKSTHITVTKESSSNGCVGSYALAVYNSGDTFTSKLSNDNGYIIYTDGTEKILVGYNGTETDLVLPSYITKINQYAFRGCDSLTSIMVSENNTAYQSIDGNLYSKDGKTLIQYAIGKAATSFTIPDSVTSIGDEAFYSCDSLTSVVIPDSVTSIGKYAFYYCTSLTSIKYHGTQAEWNAISKGNGWNLFTGSYTITYNYQD